MSSDLTPIFVPRSIAVIGASEVPGKAAERRTRSLIEGGFSGNLYPINPKRDTIFGRKAYPSILDIEGEVDLVMVVIPPKFIPQAVADSTKKGARGIIIITAGLGETGEEGKRIEAEILSIAAQGGARIIGPNCSGMFSAAGRMNLLGVPPIQEGPLSVLAQSGNIIDSLTHYGQMKKVGFRYIISAGNAIGVKFHEYIEHLGNDEATKVILVYMEGIKGGGTLVDVVRRVSQKKPVIALKVGRSKAGARAVSSHTGSLAGDDDIVDAAFRQAGIIRVSNVDEMFDLATAFSTLPLPKGRRVAIVSEGGGDNSVAADNAERWGMEVPVLPTETQERIRPFLLEGMPAGNPIDYGGTAEENPDMITNVCHVLMEEPQVDGIYVTGFFGGFKDIIAPHVADLEEQTARDLVQLVETYKKPLVVHTSFAHDPITSLEILKEHGIPVLGSSDRAAQCCAALMNYAITRETRSDDVLLEILGTPPQAARTVLDAVRRDGRTHLLETEGRDLFDAYDIALPPALLASDAATAVTCARELGYPVAIKVVSPDIIHKSDVGGVRLGLHNDQDVAAAFEAITANVRTTQPASRIIGMLISPMVPKGVECIVGLIQDPQFGPTLMFGLGGIFVEVLKDVAFRVAPPTRGDIDNMIGEIKGYPVLEGIRGDRPMDVGALRDILTTLARMGLENREIREVDCNPVIVHDHGASIVDVRVVVG